jgi:hypothetical protein
VAAQAFTPPKGLGAVTLAWQYVDNTGHRLSDGFFRPTGPSVTMSALLDVEYGVTDRLAASLSIPYVFAKYTGELPPLSGQPADACRCWHSAFQDYSLVARYRFGDQAWAVTPLVRFDIPSHDYAYRGEAVVGKQLNEAHVGLSAGARLAGLLSDASVHATYTYAFVEKALDEISVDRSNLSVDLGYALSRRLYVRVNSTWLWTHGGLRLGSVSGNPFPLPGELNTPQRLAEADRLRRVRWGQVGGGASYSVGPVDIFASFTKYIWGRDAHNGQAYNLGATWYFDLSN